MPQGQAESFVGDAFAQIAHDTFGLQLRWTWPDGRPIPRWPDEPEAVKAACGSGIGSVLSMDLATRGQALLVMVLHVGEQILDAIQHLQAAMTAYQGDLSTLVTSATNEVQSAAQAVGSATAVMQSATDEIARVVAALGSVTNLTEVEAIATQLESTHQALADTTSSLDTAKTGLYTAKTGLDDTKAKLDQTVPMAPVPTPEPPPAP